VQNEHFLHHILLRKGSIHIEDLYKPGGQYLFKSGVNPNAIIAWAIGFAIYLGFSPMLMEKVLQIKTAFPWAIGSSLHNMVVVGLIYWSMNQRRVFYHKSEP